jgi:hypothetical protein
VAPELVVSADATSDQSVPHAAALTGGGFVIVWVHQDDGSVDTNVRARAFGADGVPTTVVDLSVTSYASADVYAPHVAPAPDGGFVVAWQAYEAGSPTLADYPLLVRRFAANGASQSRELHVATKTIDLTAIPSVAVRPSDGAIAVAWHDCGELGDGQACGIRLRVLHARGLPSGGDILANTTLTGDQRTPAIVPFPADGFLAAWTDGSMLPPDTAGSGVRARVLYPSLDRHDGTIGSLCGAPSDPPCLADLLCATSPDAQSLCHPICSLPDETPCPLGGTCRSNVCLYD